MRVVVIITVGFALGYGLGMIWAAIKNSRRIKKGSL